MKSPFHELANSYISTLTPYKPGKPIEELERELGIISTIKLASNENPLGASPAALLAAQNALANSHIYPDGGGYELKQALSGYLSVPADYITLGNGSENILELIIKAYLNSATNAVISEYAFLTIPILIQSYGAKTKVVPAIQWGHAISAMVKAIDENTRLLFLVNPNNPTGTYTNIEDFNFLMRNVPKHVLVVVDEAYIEYISVSDYPRALDYLSLYPNLIITRTFSKAYGLAALRLGFAISSPEIADILNRARLPFNVNTIAAKAAIAALTDQQHVEKSIRINQEGMLQLKNALNQLGLRYISSLGNFITIDVGNAKTVYEKLLHAGVIVRPLYAYNMPKHIRVTIGTPEQNIRFITSLKAVLQHQSHSIEEEMAEKISI